MPSLLHISDVHFGPPHLAQLAAGVLRLVADRRPDALVVSGDLTQRAKPRQFRAARDFVARVEVPVLAVPGNHDVPMYRFWERALQPYAAYRRHFAAELEPTLRLPGLTLVGVNTAFNWTIKGGRFAAAQARRVAAAFDGTPAGSCRVIVAHHHLLHAPGFDDQPVMRNADAAARAFAAAGVELVLSGHHHVAWAGSSAEFFPDARPPFVVVHSGTTTSGRYREGEPGENSCNWIDVSAAEILVTTLRWRRDENRFAEHRQARFPRRG